ncbi:MAG TPA: amino acid permease [Parachlamydiales bacterium]|nr:amino acid permease [Parachlamydiales bacterium]
MNISSRSKISFFALVLLIISAIDSNRNLPASAIFGAPLIFFFLFSSVFFLFPSALVAAELSATFPEEGGIYHWVKAAFGESFGMLAIWLQWINTIVWYPTILTFIAGTLSYLFDPTLMNHKIYMICATSTIFWGLTLANLFGLRISSTINTMFASIGTVFPMLFLIVLASCWAAFGHPFQIEISAKSIFPSLANLDTWTALQAVMGSFLGMELSGVHIAHIPHPQKTFPKAILLSSLYILGTMLFGSLAIAVVLPVSQINLAGGLMQVFDNFFQVFGLGFLVPCMTLLIVIGSIGGMINWLISPAKGLLQAAEYGFLPKVLAKTNRHGVAGRILIGQAVLVTLFCFLLLFLPSVNAFYWFLTALSNSLYMFMYVLMFLSGYRLRSKPLQRIFQIPGGRLGLALVILLGLIGSMLTILFGFIPPEHIDVGSSSRYTLMIAAGNFLLILPGLFLILYKKRSMLG